MATAVETIRIIPASWEHLESFRQCVDSVAHERKWLGAVEAHSPEETREFVGKMIADDASMFFALDCDRVVGFIDIKPNPQEGSRHRGLLGMGVHADFRGRGIGKRLLEAALEKAKRSGLMRIDLCVYGANSAAYALYQRFGFKEEGRMVKGRYIDGEFDDVTQMGLIFDENVPR